MTSLKKYWEDPERYRKEKRDYTREMMLINPQFVESRRAAGRKCYWKHREERKVKRKLWRADVKIEALIRYNPTGRLACATCQEHYLRVLTLSHYGPTPGFKGGGTNLFLALKKAGYPDLPLLTECMNCNLARDNWGKEKGWSNDTGRTAWNAFKPIGNGLRTAPGILTASGYPISNAEGRA